MPPNAITRSFGHCLAIAAITAATGCSGGRGGRGPVSRIVPSTTLPSPTAGTSSLPPIDPYAPVRPLVWSACDGGRQCAQLDVPLDYGNPTGPRINVALERHVATDLSNRIGSLVINPGGPGESGIGNFSKDLALLPAQVLARFDVVTFDPRGVGASSPVHCSATAYAGPAPDPAPPTLDAAQPLVASDRAYAESCLQASGSLLLDHVGSVDAARDLEVLRRAVGDAGLSYLGLSYGTLLGATYADVFPTHVRAMVLDGVIDPALSTTDLEAAQAHGFEESLSSFFSWCTASPNACAWHPSGDPHAAFQAMAASLRSKPLGALGVGGFYTGTFGTLYSRSFWPSLGRALAGVAAGNGSAMEALYNGYERVGDPTFSGDANNAITCLDHPVPTDPAAYPALAAAAAASAPDFGPLFAWGGLTCGVWSVPASAVRTPGPVRATGSPPLLVVGTTQDPATPYAWARALAGELDHGVLLTREGVDHVAIFYSSCVRGWDEKYLVDLLAPPAGTTCA